MHSAKQTHTSARKPEANGANHSMLSGTATLLADPNQELETLLATYRTDFAPAGAHEDFLVTELAVCDWRVKHITRIEAGVMANMMQASYIKTVIAEQTEPGEQTVEMPGLSETSPDTQTAMMGAGWLNNPNAFALLLRYQTQARRDYYKALKQLERVRKPLARESGAPAQQTKSDPAPTTEKNETNPNVTDYQLKWDVEPFFVYDPTFLDRLAQPVNKPKTDDDIDFTKAHRPRQTPTLGL